MKTPKWFQNAIRNDKRYLKRKRFYFQVLFAVLLNFSFGLTGYFALRWLCVPVLNCWACPFAVFGCPIGIMANLAALHLVALGAIGVLVSVGVLLGRWTCGWVCPFGWIQELLYMIPTPKLKLPAFFRYGKYLTLLFMVFVFPWLYGGGTVSPADLAPLQEAGYTEDAGPYETDDVPSPTAVEEEPEGFPAFAANELFFCSNCPAGTLMATIPLSLWPDLLQKRLDYERRRKILEAGMDPDEVTDDDPDFPRLEVPEVSLSSSLAKVGILAFFLLLFVFMKRPFCRAVCPIGAVLGLMSRVSLLRLKVDPDKCIQCDACTKRCPQGISIYKQDYPVAECILCNECVVVCPTKAISYENPFKLARPRAPDAPPEKKEESA